MKYNRSKIMKRAWELVRKMYITISEALKKAWSEAKNACVNIKSGKHYTVKNWFANKIANELKQNITMCNLYGILKETEKAVYAMLVLGSERCKTTWIPKSVLIEKEVGFENELYNHETLFFDSYEEMRKEFYIDWRID